MQAWPGINSHVYAGPTASAQKASQIFQGMITPFRQLLVEEQIVINHLYHLDQTDLKRLLSLD